MNTFTTQLSTRRGSRPTARHASAVTRSPSAPVLAQQPGWLDRLAAWSDRTPTHHRMGSYNR
ncbi:hypothetical protein [Hydrogenophaga sp.]|uniref:hypothetical protein n=1 Tax=Hydrogenophaga sp. TaxID=1904254 RepID=UPI003569F1DD